MNINDKAYSEAAKKLGLPKTFVKEVFNDYCKVIYQKFMECDVTQPFVAPLPKLGKLTINKKLIKKCKKQK